MIFYYYLCRKKEKIMWIFSSRDNEWINTEKCLRLFRDGQNGWAFLQQDGQAVHITDEEYDKALNFIDPSRRPRRSDSDHRDDDRHRHRDDD